MFLLRGIYSLRGLHMSEFPLIFLRNRGRRGKEIFPDKVPQFAAHIIMHQEEKFENKSKMVLLGVYEQEEDGDHVYLAETGEAKAPKTADRFFLRWKWSSPFLVYGLLALAYLLIIILLGLLLSNESKFSSEVKKLHKQLEMSKELFPCGSRSREWEYFDGRCYYFSLRKAIWHTANSLCAERNSSLVVIHDEAKQNFLESRTKNERYWIGLTDVNEEGQWRWIDGISYLNSYKKWRQGEPNDHESKEDCAQMHESGEWNDVPCNFPSFYACEKPLPS